MVFCSIITGYETAENWRPVKHRKMPIKCDSKAVEARMRGKACITLDFLLTALFLLLPDNI